MIYHCAKVGKQIWRRNADQLRATNGLGTQIDEMDAQMSDNTIITLHSSTTTTNHSSRELGHCSSDSVATSLSEQQNSDK